MKIKPFKVSTFLNRAELDFLYALEQDIYFDQGIRIPRSKLIQEIIAILNQNRILSKESLQQELIQRLKKYSQSSPKGFEEADQ